MLFQQIIDNVRPDRPKPDIPDLWKNLDVVIKEHAKATDHLATSIQTAVSDSNAVAAAGWSFAGQALVLGIIAGFVIAKLFEKPKAT